jgi:hypothetical protein
VGLVALACLQTLVGILDYCGVFGQTFYFGHIELFGYLYPRAIGTLGNPNNLGIFQALALIVLASTGALRERRAQVAFAVIAFGILLSFSKTAVTALAVTAFLSFIAAGGRLRSARTLQIGLAFVVLMALVAGSRIGGAPGLEGIFGSRADTAQNAIDAWLSGPVSTLLGNGFASGTAVTADGTISEVVIDNMILALGVEGGLIGLLVFATVVLSGLRLTWMAPARDPLATVARRFGLFLVIYTPLAVNFRLFPGALFFWLLVGLAAGSARRAAPA